MERPNAWKGYGEEQLAALNSLCEDYKTFISDNKTERECVTASVELARAAGYECLDERIKSGEPLKPGDKVYAVNRGKSLMLVHPGHRAAGRGREHPRRARRLPPPGRQAGPRGGEERARHP